MRRILNICAVVVLLKEKGTCCISCDVFNLNTTGGRWSRSDCFALLLFFCNRLPFSTLNQKGIPAVVTVIYEHCYFFKFQTISVRRTIAHVGFLRPWSISLGPSHSEKKKKKSCSTSNNHRVLPCARSSQRCHWSADLLTLLLYDMHMFGVYFLYVSSFVSEYVVVCI